MSIMMATLGVGNLMHGFDGKYPSVHPRIFLVSAETLEAHLATQIRSDYISSSHTKLSDV